MAISTYDELKTAVTNWMARGDVAGDAASFIMLGEAHLNRELKPVMVDATITGTAGSRSIDISSMSCVSPQALFLAETGRDEVELTKKQDGTFPYIETSTGRPSIWAIDGANIDFDRKLDAAYPFRFRYRQRFALSDSASTNWLLTNHPDVYLAATLVWGGIFIQSSPQAGTFGQILAEGIPSVRNTIAQQNRAVLSVPMGLQMIGRRMHYDGIE